jgi:hypothetical protein
MKVFVYYIWCMREDFTMMQFIEGALASLHVSWYAMLGFTILPLVLSISRQLSFVYLVAYAISGACVVLYGTHFPSPPSPPFAQTLQSKLDEKARIFQAIKLQEL